ncbi:MAG: P1 family peptidase [Candidatus Sungbacteria bacterium]|nr:P1 family peptidase [Candidatus Sungbacteria bacterium]
MESKNNKKRFAEYGFQKSFLPAGAHNRITDVEGVRVGHYTKIEGKNIRTGITIIDPGIPDFFQMKTPAAIAVGNGYGKLVGITQVEELGTLETPIGLTNTLAVGTVMRGLVDIVLDRNKTIAAADSINAVVGETNDGFLNDLHADTLTKDDVRKAYENCSTEFVIGNVGAGTGTRAFWWKGGVGTASRVVAAQDKKYIVGVLVQTNYGGALTLHGVPVGRLLKKTDFDAWVPRDDGSCMIVLATDAPFTSRQLGRVAHRTFVGLARTGSVLSTGSGDYAIAFTTSRDGLESSGAVGSCMPDSQLNVFFLAAAEATEEAVYDALFAAETMKGRAGNVLEAIPHDAIVDLMKRYLPHEN